MRLAITRDQSQLAELFAEARTRKVELVPLPLTALEPIAFSWPLPNNPHIDWLVFTSAHGVQMFFKRIDAISARLGKETRIAVVGGKTALAVINSGYDVSFVPSDSYGETLFRELIDRYLHAGNCLVYARAEEVVTDPVNEMKAHGVDYHEVVCYRSVPLRGDRSVVEGLKPQDRILFTAPSKVSAYHAQFGIPLARAIAIGRTTAGEMKRLGWPNVAVLRKADIASIWEKL